MCTQPVSALGVLRQRSGWVKGHISSGPQMWQSPCPVTLSSAHLLESPLSSLSPRMPSKPAYYKSPPWGWAFTGLTLVLSRLDRHLHAQGCGWVGWWYLMGHDTIPHICRLGSSQGQSIWGGDICFLCSPVALGMESPLFHFLEWL